MLALTGLCSSCSNSLDDLVVQSHELPVTDVTVVTEGSAPAKALAVANAVLQKNQSRSAAMPEFAYVLNKLQSRSLSLPDTLACVVNYPNDGGFVIVANDPRVESVLAYSDTGNFSFDNEIAKVNFIDKIGAYIEQAVANPAPQQAAAASSSSNEYLEVEPFSKMLLGQWDPWNKYVVKHHPGWPVGCVAVAAATVMTYSRKHLKYKDSTIMLDCLASTLERGDIRLARFDLWVKNTSKISLPPGVTLPDSLPHRIYVYDEAVDRMAKFLDQISTDLNMDYRPKDLNGNDNKGSYSSIYRAHTLCSSLGFTIPGGVQDFKYYKIAKYLRDNHIVFIDGTSSHGGHAWVIDGCKCKIQNNLIWVDSEAYLHCDWGWAGQCNGYFSGRVFDTIYGNWKVSSFFAVKREY